MRFESKIKNVVLLLFVVMIGSFVIAVGMINAPENFNFLGITSNSFSVDEEESFNIDELQQINIYALIKKLIILSRANLKKLIGAVCLREYI